MNTKIPMLVCVLFLSGMADGMLQFENNPSIQNQQQIKDLKKLFGITEKQRFSPEEDEKLKLLVQELKHNWRAISEKMPGRSPRQCRERWSKYLNPSRNNTSWTLEEDATLINLVNQLGTKWSKISEHFNGRTDMDCKNRWNGTLNKGKKSVIVPNKSSGKCYPLPMINSFQLEPYDDQSLANTYPEELPGSILTFQDESGFDPLYDDFFIGNSLN